MNTDFKRGVFTIIAAVAMLSGCGGSPTSSTDGAGPKANDGLADLVDLLKEAGATPPKSVADLAVHEGMHPAATAFIQNGSVVYYFGNSISSSGNLVIAHESKAATDGGWALLQDGTLKQMTADEFKAAAKADVKK